MISDTQRLILAIAATLLLPACAANVPIKSPEYEPTQPVVRPVAQAAEGSIYSDYNNRFLFEDIKARRVGDLITVLLEESTNATKSASTNTQKNTGISLPTPTLFGMTPTFRGTEFLNNDADADLAFAGTGDSTQSNRLSGDITVTIAEVMSNGNMLVRGEKLLTLNQGSEVMRISGIVRPADVAPDNTVLSTRIANAEITYSGQGAIADSNSPGWLTRILGSTLWPF